MVERRGIATAEPTVTEDRVGRRDFFRWAGISLGAMAAQACERGPVEKAIPYLIQPEEVTPGEATYYTSVCGACPAGCGLIGKCLDGRPVKLEGNPQHPLSRGGLCAIGQASILGLYDSHRLPGPLREGVPSAWEEVDREIKELLQSAANPKGAVYVLSGTINSPTLRSTIERFLAGFPRAVWVTYDPISSSGICEAHALTHGIALLPQYRFERAELIVGIDADFLGTWISPVEFTEGYRDGRTLEGSRLRLSRHYQFESLLTITGAKADRRVSLPAGRAAGFMAFLAALLAARSGDRLPFDPPEFSLAGFALPEAEDLADQLWNLRGKSIVVCGINDPGVQVIGNWINHTLGNYGRTVDLQYPSYQQSGNEQGLGRLLADLEKDTVSTLLVISANPVYDLPIGDLLSSAMRRLPLTVYFGRYLDETAACSRFVCPEPHFLEVWGDSEPTARVAAIRQPMVRPLSRTRSTTESLTRWMGEEFDDHQLVRRHWNENLYHRRVGLGSFDEFWQQSLLDGHANLRPERVRMAEFREDALARFQAAGEPTSEYPLVLQLYPSVALRDGEHALNPWLQELPDPLTGQAWGNWASLSPELAGELAIEDGAVVRLQTELGQTIEVPTVIQPAQDAGTIGLALGHGRAGTERFNGYGPEWLEAGRFSSKGRVGIQASHLVRVNDGRFSYTLPVRVEVTGVRSNSASRPGSAVVEAGTSGYLGEVEEEILRELPLNKLLSTRPRPQDVADPDLWTDDRVPGEHHWAMVIDLGACTGCGACVIACQAENNIPAVGEDEFRRNRTMHWLRIDRYYTGERSDPTVWFQPMLCQHCDRAPCETVCPVLATVHSSEGLNEQIYSRCIGTRYCANNCPYRARAFNWFDYSGGERMENLQLNPEVAVRGRGVMEKCSFCAQRILRAKLTSRIEQSPLEIQPACQETCPARAIVFGDLRDPASPVSTLYTSPRRYRVLEKLGTRPSVSYLALVRNRPSEDPGVEQ